MITVPHPHSGLTLVGGFDVTIVHQPGYYLIRKPGEPFVCEWADSPKDISLKVFGEVLRGKAGEWKYLGDKSLVVLGGPERETAEGPDGWNRMDNRGAYKRDPDKVASRPSTTPRLETPPGYDPINEIVGDIITERTDSDLVLDALQRGLDTVEKWAVKFDRLGMVKMAEKVRRMGKEFEEAVLGPEVAEAAVS